MLIGGHKGGNQMDRGASRFCWVTCAAALLCASTLATNAARAAEQQPSGVWVIESAVAAPWADPAQPIASDEPKRLIGKTVTFGRKAVEAPAPIGCAKPVYATRHDGADMLFQGALAEPDKDGKPRDAAALAQRLGMTTATVVTYEIGCSEFEFHALAPGALSFGLNDRIYTMRPMSADKAPKGALKP